MNSNLRGRGNITIAVKWTFCFITFLVISTNNRDRENDFGISYDIISAIQRELSKIQFTPNIENEVNFAIFPHYFIIIS